MAISLYDVSVTNFTQVLTGVAGVLDRGLAHFSDNNIDPEEIVSTRLHPEMLPFSFQVISVAHHSVGALEGVRKGEFSPGGPPASTYADLQKVIADAREALAAVTPEEVNGFEGKEVFFKFGQAALPFTAENFLMSFSTPNLFFHATTTYDILRMKGVPLGKRDFMGPLRMKR